MQPLKEQEKTLLWLDQFDQSNDRQLAETLLDSINYCPLNEFKNSLTKLIRNELPPQETSALFIERELPKTKAKLPPPIYKQKKTYNPRSKKKHLRAYGAAVQAVKSLTYTTQDVGSEGIVAFIANTLCRAKPKRFLLQPTAENIRKLKVYNLVILTDFIGSGKRARDMLDAMWKVASIRSWYSGRFVRFWVLAYSGTQQGITNIQKHRFAPKVRVATECPTLFNSFDEDLDEMVELCETYGAHSSTPLGFERTAALLAFEHGAPNNMPAIFVSEKNTGNRRWAPLFPKRVTDNLWQSTEINMSSITKKALEALKLSEISKSRRFQNASDETKSAMIVLLAYSQGRRRIAELRRILPLSLDSLIRATHLAQKRGWVTGTGALTLAGQKTIRTLRRERRKFLVAADPFTSYYPQQLRAPQ